MIADPATPAPLNRDLLRAAEASAEAREASGPVVWLLVDTRSVGGIERHVATLAACLQQGGHRVEVAIYADYGPNPWIAQLDALGLSHRFLPGTPSGLFKAVRAARPALIHTHGYKAGILGRLAAKALAIPVVSTYHSGEKAKYPVGMYYLIDDWTCGLAHSIAVSRPIQQRLPFASRHIPNFVVVPPSPPPARALPRSIAFIGRLSHEKAPDLFCELARASQPGLAWHVYGDGPMRASLEAIYSDCVKFHGIVTAMDDVWPTVGALLMPSRHEGLPLAALEALCQGVPVLASRVGGVPTVVQDGRTGWLFETGDTAGAQAAIAAWRQLDEDGQARLRQSCWNHVTRHFAASVHVPVILDVYRQAGYRNAPVALARVQVATDSFKPSP